jgi:hypothetical protein
MHKDSSYCVIKRGVQKQMGDGGWFGVVISEAAGSGRR